MKAKKSILSIFFSAALLFIFLGWSAVSAYSTAPQTPGSILYVKASASGTCASWADACELQTALSNAVAGNQIWVAAGTYIPSSSNRSTPFQLKSGVAIYGGFPVDGGAWETRDWETNITTLSGDIGGNSVEDNSYHVVTGSEVDETAVLDGFTISGGNANGNPQETTSTGGGMYNFNGSPRLSNVTFSGNSAFGGGGIFNHDHSSPSLSNVTFSSNSANDGGGMRNESSSPSLSNVTFSGNSAAYGGGGMFNSGSSPSLSNVTFSSNSATYVGGGMYNYDSSSPSLSNVTFSGNSAYDGGGMYNESSSSPSLSNVTFSSNSADYGGGMCNFGSSPSLSNVTFSSNSADAGGGMYNFGSNPSLSNVTFSNNTTTDDNGSGGGMYNEYYSSPSLSNVTFSGNSAGSGGGMSNSGISSPNLSNVTFSGNSADGGGGMFNYYSSPSLSNVTFSGNSAYVGGGMYNYENSSPSLTNVTFSGNSATYFGGGMYNYISNPTVTNSILWGNNPEQVYNDSLASVTVTYSDIQGGYTGNGNINEDPLLGPLADHGSFTQTRALGKGSPAIDAGNPSNCPATDQRGFPRPFDGDGNGTATCDMGAYEYGFLLFLPVILR